MDATEAVASVNEFAKDFNNLKTTVKGKVDDAYVEDGYLYMTADDEVVVGPLGPFSGGGGGGGGDVGSLIRIVNKLTSRAFSVMNGATVEIKFNWTSTDTSDEQPTGDGSATWRINGTKVATQAVSQGDCTFDATKYLTPASANTIKLTIEDAYGQQSPSHGPSPCPPTIWHGISAPSLSTGPACLPCASRPPERAQRPFT